MFEVNVNAPLDLALAAAPAMIEAGEGWIVNLSSGSADGFRGTGVRVNTVEPRAAVLSEGAAELVGDILKPDQIESMEAMVEGTVVLCDCAVDVTGRITVSLDNIAEWGLAVHNLDGSPQ